MRWLAVSIAFSIVLLCATLIFIFRERVTPLPHGYISQDLITGRATFCQSSVEGATYIVTCEPIQSEKP